MKLTISTAVISLLVLSACSSGSNGNIEPSPATGQATMEMDSILGLWNFPPEVSGDGSINESYSDYLEITDVSVSAYIQSKMANCYNLFEFPLSKVAGTTYSVSVRATQVE